MLDRYAEPGAGASGAQAMQLEELLGYLRSANNPAITPLESILVQTESIGDPALPSGEQLATLHWIGAAFDDWEKQFPLEDPLAAEMRRLKPMVAAIALTDPEFFVPGRHPLHQLMDNLQLAAVGWQARLGRAGEFLEKQVATAVNGALEWLQGAETDLAELCKQVVASSERDMARAARMVQRMIEVEQGRLKTATAKRDAAEMINAALQQHRAPSRIAEFLKGAWYESAQLVLLKYGVESDEWQQMSATTLNLLDSLQSTEDEDPARRQHIFEVVTKLPKELKRWLLSLQHDSEGVNDAIGLVEYVHLRILRKQPLELGHNMPIPVTQVRAVARTEEALESIREGQWFSVKVADGGTVRARLALRVNDEQRLLFSNLAGVKVLQPGFAEFAALLENGGVSQLDSGASFSRSLARVTGIKTTEDLQAFLARGANTGSHVAAAPPAQLVPAQVVPEQPRRKGPERGPTGQRQQAQDHVTPDQLEQEKLKLARLEQERLNQERLDQEKLNQERLQRDRLEQERLEQLRLAQEEMAQARLEQERQSQQSLNEERLNQEKLQRDRLEQERLEQLRLAQEEMAQVRLEQERLKRQHLEQEQNEQERLAHERAEQDRLERERLAQDRLEQDRLERERLAQERTEQERLERERLALERHEREQVERERIEQIRLERERLEQERIEQEQIERERIEQIRLERERLEQERIEQEQIERERIEQIRLERQRLEQERLEQERLERERLEQERIERERVERERLEQERIEQDRLERERLAQERIEQDRLERERLAQERIEQERLERERIERERQERERLEQERIEQERLERERLEREKIRLRREEMLRLYQEQQEEARRQEELAEQERAARRLQQDPDQQGIPDADSPGLTALTLAELDLSMGAWLGFYDGKNPLLAKLAVYDLENDSYTFVNRLGIKVRQLSKRELQQLMANGAVDLLENRSAFRDEVSRMKSQDETQQY